LAEEGFQREKLNLTQGFEAAERRLALAESTIDELREAFGSAGGEEGIAVEDAKAGVESLFCKGLRGELEGLEADVATQQTVLIELISQVATTEAELHQTQGELQRHRVSLPRLAEEYQSSLREVNTAREELGGVKKELKTVQGDLLTAQGSRRDPLGYTLTGLF